MAEVRGETTEDPFLNQQNNLVSKGRDTTAAMRASPTPKATGLETANTNNFQLHS